MPDAHDHPDHGHTHAHGVPQQPVDPAQQSLADALRASFLILKGVMIALIVAYAFSGLYQVKPQEQAVQLFFGNITGDTDEERVKRQGWHFGWPFPIGEVVRVPTSKQTLDLSSAFMFEIDPRNRAQSLDQMSGGALNPEIDGSLITADANLVHAKFSVSYTITSADDFITNVGDFYDFGTAGQSGDRTRWETLLRAVISQAIVRSAAKTPSDEFIASRANLGDARLFAQARLDDLKAGVKLEVINIIEPTMPLAVRDAYNLVTQAESRRNELVNQAQTARRETLGAAAGAAALPVPGGGDGPLVAMVKAYELADAAEDEAELQRLSAELDAAFRALRVQTEEQGFDIGGEAAAIINGAQSDRTALVQGIEAEADAFRKLLESYRANPQLVRQLEWQRARTVIFGPDSDIETFMAPQGQLWIELNRDPEIVRERERRRIEEDRAARQAQP